LSGWEAEGRVVLEWRGSKGEQIVHRSECSRENKEEPVTQREIKISKQQGEIKMRHLPAVDRFKRYGP